MLRELMHGKFSTGAFLFFALRVVDLLDVIGDVRGRANHSLFGDRALNRLAYPGGRVGGEFATESPVKELNRAKESEIAFIYEFVEGESLVAEIFGDRNDETQVVNAKFVARGDEFFFVRANLIESTTDRRRRFPRHS